MGERRADEDGVDRHAGVVDTALTLPSCQHACQRELNRLDGQTRQQWAAVFAERADAREAEPPSAWSQCPNLQHSNTSPTDV